MLALSAKRKATKKRNEMMGSGDAPLLSTAALLCSKTEVKMPCYLLYRNFAHSAAKSLLNAAASAAKA
jgi:hypothetical protein